MFSMNANHVLITLSCFTGGLLANTRPRCDPGQYYDPITGSCHPCSDCSHGRPGNIYCKKGCKGGTECEESKYYDPHTDLCHPCTDCDPPRPSNKFCLAQCTTTSSLTTDTLVELHTTDSTVKILTIVFPVVLCIIVLVLVVLGIYSCVRRCRRRTAVAETVTYMPQAEENGTLRENGVSLLLPSGVDATQPTRPVPLSLPLTLNADQHGNLGRATNSFSESRLMHQHPSSTILHEERVPLQQSVSPIRLEEDPHGEYVPRGLRRNSSAHLHSSLSGNPVCHPEQEDLATLAPTLLLSAAEPHLSLDPDKPCCDAALGENSSQTSATSRHSVSETFCKSNR